MEREAWGAGRRVWEEKHRREWQIGRQGTDLVVNVMCYIRFDSLAAESSERKGEKHFQVESLSKLRPARCGLFLNIYYHFGVIYLSQGCFLQQRSPQV